MGIVVTPGLGQVEDLFKAIVWDTCVEAALVALFSAAPWLNVWPLRAITSGTIHLFTDKLFRVARLVVDMSAIPLLNAAHKEAFAEALVRLHVIGAKFGQNSDEYKKARENAKVNFSQFVRFNG